MTAFIAGLVAGVLLSALTVGVIGVRYRHTVRDHLDGLDRANRTAEYARADALRVVTARAVDQHHRDAPGYYLNNYRTATGDPRPGTARSTGLGGHRDRSAASGTAVRPASPPLTDQVDP